MTFTGIDHQDNIGNVDSEADSGMLGKRNQDRKEQDAKKNVPTYFKMKCQLKFKEAKCTLRSYLLVARRR